MGTRWNGLRSGVLIILCSLALLIVCGGLVPMAVQAETPDKPVIDWDTVSDVLIAGKYMFETDSRWVDVYDEDGEWEDCYEEWFYPNYDEDQDVFIIPTHHDGKVIFDYKTNTLTLQNASIGSVGNSVRISRNVTMVLEGDNSIYNGEWGLYGILACGDLTIQGSGSLTMERTNCDGYGGAILVNGNLTIQDGATVKVTGVPAGPEMDERFPDNGICAYSNMTIRNATVELEKYTGCGLDIGYNGGNLTIQDGVLRMSTSGTYVEAGNIYALKAYGDRNVAAVYVKGDSEVTLAGPIEMGRYFKGQLDNEVLGIQVTPNNEVGTVAIELGQEYAYSNSSAQTTAYKGSYTLSRDAIGRSYYVHITSASTNPSQRTAAAKEDTKASCNHRYTWEVYKAATATTDGVMRYRCTKCGTVEYEVPTAAYYVFNKDAQEAIKNAAAGATVTVGTPVFISFHEMVKDALAARADVTLVVDYTYQGVDYEMTIPAGSGELLEQLFGEDQFEGFRYLAGAFATVVR